MTRMDPSWLSILLPVPPGAEGLDFSLLALARLEGQGWECLLACHDARAWEAAGQACARHPGPWQVPAPPLSGAGSALSQALAQARGDVALFLACGAAVPSHLPALLREHFTRPESEGLGLALQPPSGGGPLAGLAGLEMLARQEDSPWPRLGCAAFRRRDILENGGLASAPGLEVLDLWLRLATQGKRLDWEAEAYLVLEQPKTLGALLNRARREGRAMFGRRRLLRHMDRGAGQAKDSVQILLALAAPCLLGGFWAQAPDRAITLGLLAWLLLYPLNRPFLRQVAEYRPGVVGQAMLYCMLRPYAWLLGMAQAGGNRLSSG